MRDLAKILERFKLRERTRLAHDLMAEETWRGEMIEAGTEVEVVEVSGNRVVVSTSAHVD